jgi:hypothetical protein
MKASTRITDGAPASEVHSGVSAQARSFNALRRRVLRGPNAARWGHACELFNAPPLERVRWRSRSVHALGPTQRHAIA